MIILKKLIQQIFLPFKILQILDKLRVFYFYVP